MPVTPAYVRMRVRLGVCVYVCLCMCVCTCTCTYAFAITCACAHAIKFLEVNQYAWCSSRLLTELKVPGLIPGGIT